MRQNSSNAISLKDWLVISVRGGIVLKYEDEEHVRLAEISRGNTLRALCLESESSPKFSEKDAWLVARVVIAMLRNDGADAWDGDSLLLPISFDGFEITNLRDLAALAYCYHTTQKTLTTDDEGGDCLYHVLFDGSCWTIAITNEYELEFIQKE